ncbi:SET domain-containing protein [uncultured Sphingomonas sp.]|uniref:SET domain-containing protein n=1 Tax=uncultured Sphingomonas sp. TaxID=158754 RepID=UPI0035CC7493
MTVDPWFLGALIAGLGGYLVYARALQTGSVVPSRASWLIWSATTAVEAATYAAVNPVAPQRWLFVAGALACVLVTAAIWVRARWSALSAGDLACVLSCLGAIMLWLAFDQAYWAHMLVIFAVPVSFWPTWRGAVADPDHERSSAWSWWTIGDAATLAVALRAPSGGTGLAQAAGVYGYLAVELACHAAVWLIVLRPVGRPFGWTRARPRIVRGLGGAELFRIGETHLGKAVHAARAFREGEVLTRFSGPRVAASRVPTRLVGRRDRFVQVSADQYMGPSGAIDDLINHSCAPNAGLRFGEAGVFLIAIRDIAVGEEIAWDYSTTLTDRSWQMVCACGASDCRGTIGAFETLSPERQEWFRARNLVAPYLRRRDRIWRRDRAA